jgi:hypothetical protein
MTTKANDFKEEMMKELNDFKHPACLSATKGPTPPWERLPARRQAGSLCYVYCATTGREMARRVM